MTNLIDIIKAEFLAEFSAISLGQMLIAIALAFVLSLYIVFIYRCTYAGVNFSRSFAGCIILIAMVTAVVIQVITSNVVLSLGMVGALSIVRFRTAVKEPADTAFLFWAIAAGIICGAGYITVAILATLLVGLLFVAVYTLGRNQKTNRYMVVIRCEPAADPEAQLASFRGYRLKNKTMTGQVTELVAELTLHEEDMKRLSRMQTEEGILEITIMRSVSGSVL